MNDTRLEVEIISHTFESIGWVDLGLTIQSTPPQEARNPAMHRN